MHDIEPDGRKRMPPLIVLGLTGPIGSGCTTVSNTIFDNPNKKRRGKGNELLKVLNRIDWIKTKEEKGFDINWEGLNKEVDGTYKKLVAVEKAVKDFDTCKNQDEFDKLKDLSEKIKKELKEVLYKKIEDGFDLKEQLVKLEENLRNKLKKDLETREAIKALDKLNAYYKKDKHLFSTISVSDLIVFRTLMAIEKDDFNLDGIDDERKKRKYERFVKIARNNMNKKLVKSNLSRIGIDRYGEYFKHCYDWKDKDELKKLGEVFYSIHRIANIIKKDFNKKHPYDYAEVMQDFGDNIRRYDQPFGQKKSHRPKDNAYKLAKGVAQLIYLLYKTDQGAFFIIDCLRNPYEVIYLRREFANFFLLSLYADKKVREKRFIRKARRTWGRKFKEDKVKKLFEAIDKRDSGKDAEGEESLYKQNVTKCVLISDMAINNVREWREKIDTIQMDTEEFEKTIETIKEFCRKPLRMICLIMSAGCTKPNDNEMWMNLAYTMAVESNCISRQVGAVIIGPKGYVVGAGWNDVGAGGISCGLRAIRDLKIKQFKPIVEAIIRGDERSTKDVIERLIRIHQKTTYENAEQFCFCFKDEMVKKDITPRLVQALYRKVEEAVEKIKSEKSEEVAKIDSKTFQKAEGFAKNTGKRILSELVEEGNLHKLEYCLALHAEENAIIQSSKIGGMGLKGATIYTTAQPCPLCAKMIQQVGIRKVIYTEAYPESLSEVYMKGITLEQFEGIKPRAYIKLFMPHHDQKEWQELESLDLIPAI